MHNLVITPISRKQPINQQLTLARALTESLLSLLSLVCGIGRQLISVTGLVRRRPPLLLQVTPAACKPLQHVVHSFLAAFPLSALLFQGPRALLRPFPFWFSACLLIVPRRVSFQLQTPRCFKSLGRVSSIGWRHSQWSAVSKVSEGSALRSACSNNMAAASIGRV